MTRHRWLAVGIAFLAGALGAIAAPGLKEGKSDLKKLEGEWKAESWVQLGQKIEITADWSITGEKYALSLGSNMEEGSLKLDQGKKPASIDLAITGGSCKGKDQVGIYKFDGETLIFCFAWPGATERPTEFTSTAENRCILVTLKRVKKDK